MGYEMLYKALPTMLWRVSSEGIEVVLLKW